MAGIARPLNSSWTWSADRSSAGSCGRPAVAPRAGTRRAARREPPERAHRSPHPGYAWDRAHTARVGHVRHRGPAPAGCAAAADAVGSPRLPGRAPRRGTAAARNRRRRSGGRTRRRRAPDGDGGTGFRDVRIGRRPARVCRRTMRGFTGRLPPRAGIPSSASIVEMVTRLFFEQSRALTDWNAEDLRSLALLHRSIYHAIRSRDAERARREMAQHLRRPAEPLESGLRLAGAVS